jgi:hypothetical protein
LLVRAPASVEAVVDAEVAVGVVTLLPVTFVAWAVAAAAASVVVASGEVLLKVATEVATAAALPAVATLLQLLVVTAAAAAALVEATATHPALAATPGGKRASHRFTI